MSGLYPQNPKFQAVNFKINTPTLSTRTFSGLTRRVGMGVSYYSFTVRHTNLTRFEAGPILGFVAAQLGPLEAFDIIIPELSYSKTTNQSTSVVLTTGGAAVGATSIGVTGVSSGKELLRAGDFFRFQNHSKVYQATETWSSGNPLRFSGGLVTAVGVNVPVVYAEPIQFRVILENDVQQWDTVTGGLVNISLDMREVW